MKGSAAMHALPACASLVKTLPNYITTTCALGAARHCCLLNDRIRMAGLAAEVANLWKQPVIVSGRWAKGAFRAALGMGIACELTDEDIPCKSTEEGLQHDPIPHRVLIWHSTRALGIARRKSTLSDHEMCPRAHAMCTLTHLRAV